MVGVARIELATPAMSTLGCGAKTRDLRRFSQIASPEQTENIRLNLGFLPRFYRTEISRLSTVKAPMLGLASPTK